MSGRNRRNGSRGGGRNGRQGREPQSGSQQQGQSSGLGLIEGALGGLNFRADLNPKGGVGLGLGIPGLGGLKVKLGGGGGGGDASAQGNASGPRSAPDVLSERPNRQQRSPRPAGGRPERGPRRRSGVGDDGPMGRMRRRRRGE